MHPKLKELEEKARAATKGPWLSDSKESSSIATDWAEVFVTSADWGTESITNSLTCANADHIAAANPDTVLKLVEVIRLQEQALEARRAGAHEKSWEYQQQADDTLNRIGEL